MVDGGDDDDDDDDDLPLSYTSLTLPAVCSANNQIWWRDDVDVTTVDGWWNNGNARSQCQVRVRVKDQESRWIGKFGKFCLFTPNNFQ